MARVIKNNNDGNESEDSTFKDDFWPYNGPYK